jgi:uncharacterized protein (TIGR02453 family)
MPYNGLSPATTAYLAALEQNNNREWFEQNRADYQANWLNAGLDLIEALSGPCAQIRLLARPKLNASLRRIHRDVRFSKDKRPYDPRLHVILSTGEAFNKVPGVHLVIGPTHFGFGAGHFGLPFEALERYRQRMSEPLVRAGFEGLLAQAAQVGCRLDAPELVRPPKGHAASDWDYLIRRKSLIVRRQGDRDLPEWLFGSGAVDGVMRIAKALNPLTQWIAKLL